MVLISGAASADGTRRFAERARAKGVVEEHFVEALGGLRLSSTGLGTYLGSADPATDLAVAEAATLVARSGRVNVLDTAINYRHQRAERSLGRALERLQAAAIPREELFLSTKVGYLAPDGESPLAPAAWVRAELIDRRVLRPNEIVDGSHAMSPAYLRDQVGRCRANLGVETIDLVYLHNAAEAELPWLGRQRFEERLGSAFGELEQLRSEGWIGAYGLATWDSLRSTRSDPSHLELEPTVQLAEAAGGRAHGLRFLQFPFNAAMPEAAAVRSQRIRGSPRTLFAAARALGLACFTSVPLLQGRLLDRLTGSDELSPAQWAVQFARSAVGSIGPVIGMKSPEHIAEDLKVAERAPWAPVEFLARLREVAGVAPEEEAP